MGTHCYGQSGIYQWPQQEWLQEKIPQDQGLNKSKEEEKAAIKSTSYLCVNPGGGLGQYLKIQEDMVKDIYLVVSAEWLESRTMRPSLQWVSKKEE